MVFDLIILGGGPGGYVAAEQAATLGLKVALVEKQALGGTCLNRGCIPTKSLLNSAKLYRHALHSKTLGVSATEVHFSLPDAMAWKNSTVSRLVANIDFLMKKNNVHLISGTGELSGPKSLRIKESGEEHTAEHIIIASGSNPARPPIPGSDNNPAVLTSNELLEITEMPESLVIIGGGVIGIEFASFFASFGIKVTVIEMLPEILPFIDQETAMVYKRTLKGIQILCATAVTSISANTVHYRNQKEEGSVEASHILLATGRKPAVDGIGLEAAGVQFNSKGIVVDNSCRTNVPSIWAIGDVNGKSLLAHSASAMGRAVARTIAGKKTDIPWAYFPWVVYGDPELAGVGLTEQEVQKTGIEYVKSSLPARANGRFLAENGMTAHGLCKILAEKNSGRILGAHIVSPYAGEIIWGMQYAIMNGATVAELENAVFPHPTVSELFHDAIGGLSH